MLIGDIMSFKLFSIFKMKQKNKKLWKFNDTSIWVVRKNKQRSKTFKYI